MSWTTARDLRAKVQRLWDRGELLRAVVADASEGDAQRRAGDGAVGGAERVAGGAVAAGAAPLTWPLRLTLRSPSAADLTDRFDAVRHWVREIGTAPQVRLEYREWKHRVQGAQRLPAAAWLDTLAHALALVERSTAAERFKAQWHRTAVQQPALLAWLTKRPLEALDLADRWDRLLAVVAWVRANPRPRVHLRQVDAPGVDSKFIEAHRRVLTELLDAALPPDALDSSAPASAPASATAQFARRFGFLEKPVRIRFRLLDPSIPVLPGIEGYPDITLDAASFAALTLEVERVFITENETNFLAFPPVARAVVVFGGGYGWAPLAGAAWLRRCRVDYWGDLDTHGFAILDQLRAELPHAASFLMDRATLLAHRAHWGEEPEPARHDLARLTAEEGAVYDDLRFDRLGTRVRLEQERVGFGWVRARLEEA